MPPSNNLGVVYDQEQIVARDFQHPPDHRLHLPIADQTPEKPGRMETQGKGTSKWPSVSDAEASTSFAKTSGRGSTVRLVDKTNALGLSSEVMDALHKQISREEAQREITPPVFDWEGARKERSEGKVKYKTVSKKDDRTWTAFILAGFKMDKRPWR